MGEDSPQAAEVLMPENLLAACKAGDESGWERLFRERAAQVYRWAVVLGLSPACAEDAAQEVLATAARRIGSCRSEHVLTSWLYQITRRVVANKRRLAWWRKVFPVEDAVLEPAFQRTGLEGPETELTVRACLSRMEKKHVELLLLAYVEGFTKEEVAKMLSIPPGTAATRLRVAKTRFRELWNEAGGKADATHRLLVQP
jgi:RNA polymerase sigma factor (sigma-70 family)